MSYKMHSTVCRDEHLLQVLDDIRALYMEKSLAVVATRQYIDKGIEKLELIDDKEERTKAQVELDREVRDLINEMMSGQDPEWAIEVQLFRRGDEWLIRPLEMGYILVNSAAAGEIPNLRPCSYDNRTEVPPEDEPNKEWADYADEQIEAQRYFTVPMVDKTTLKKIEWDRLIAPGLVTW